MKKTFVFCVICFITIICACNSCADNTDINKIVQYKAYSDNKNDTSLVYYTFKGDKLYIDEVGNEGFVYLYRSYVKGPKKYVSCYDEMYGWEEYQVETKMNGDMIIKYSDGDVLLKRQNKIVDLGFD